MMTNHWSLVHLMHAPRRRSAILVTEPALGICYLNILVKRVAFWVVIRCYTVIRWYSPNTLSRYICPGSLGRKVPWSTKPSYLLNGHKLGYTPTLGQISQSIPLRVAQTQINSETNKLSCENSDIDTFRWSWMVLLPQHFPLCTSYRNYWFCHRNGLIYIKVTPKNPGEIWWNQWIRRKNPPFFHLFWRGWPLQAPSTACSVLTGLVDPPDLSIIEAVKLKTPGADTRILSWVYMTIPMDWYTFCF